MIMEKPNLRHSLLSLIVVFLFSLQHSFAQDGKTLFISKCASCHQLDKDLTGPMLRGIIDKDPYNGDIKKIYQWIRHTGSMVTTDNHYKDLMSKFKIQMTQFDESMISDKEIDAIIKYTSEPPPPPPPTPGGPSGSSDNALIFGIISLILAVIALILLQVNSNLKKMSDDKEGIHRPDPVPFYKNKIYIAVFSLIVFVVFGYYLTKGAIGLGRQKGYEPVQPIFYSHKVHAGLNQINCLYCHASAWESKTAGIPSVNICMNCHKNINEYTKGPKLFTEEGKEVNANMEIQKLYAAAGFDPKNPSSWDPSKAKPIEWIRIHNLPDHVYFNHSQHIRIGHVQCQTCHGEITKMDEVRQFSELSMGWCINCHRQSKVDFDYDKNKGNQYYSIYEKFHNDIKAGKLDSVTVERIGGLECQKCHY